MAHRQQQQPQLSQQVAKTTTAVTVGGSMMVLSGLTLAATVILLVLATPVLVIFSPVLVPAFIALCLMFAGFLTSAGLGATATFVFYWMYRYVTGKQPIGAEKLDKARERIAGAATELKHKAEQLGRQTVHSAAGGGQGEGQQTGEGGHQQIPANSIRRLEISTVAHRQQQPSELTLQVAKTTTAVTLGGSLMVLSGVTLAGSVMGLVLATPVLTIFSPVLVPAFIGLCLIFAGFLTSGGLGATATFVFYWMYGYVTGKQPIGEDKLERVRERIARAATEVRHKAEQLGHQILHFFTGGGQGQQTGASHHQS